jgi:uncharacterized protein GlcG (DUF336 family)
MRRQAVFSETSQEERRIMGRMGTGSAARIVRVILGASALAVALPGIAPAQGLPVGKMLTSGLALEAASATLEACQRQGHRVTVTVVDSTGLPKVILRGDGAGVHTVDASRRKAYTALSMRSSTLQLDERVRSTPAATGIRDIDQILVLAGGLPISVGNDVIGGIGVGGAPGGHLDEACAQAGVDKIKDRLQ